MDAGCKVIAYDPAATENAVKALQEFNVSLTNFKIVNMPVKAVHNVDALVLITEWDEFCNINLEYIKPLMRTKVIFDGRNIFDMGKSASIRF